MSAPFSLFLALKYLKPKRTFLSVVTVISVIGVMLGVAVLIIVLSVMNGFDNMWRDKILSFNAHITVEGLGVIEAEEELIERILRVPGVIGAAPYVQSLVFLQVDDRISTPIVRGVDPKREVSVSQVPDHITSGAFSFQEGEAVIGMDLARQAGLRLGDTLLLYAPQGFQDPDELYLPEELSIAGIFELGMWEFDIGFILTSMDVARDLCHMDEGIHAIQVMTDDPLHVSPVQHRVREVVGSGYLVRTWEELNRPLFAALRVEKNLMFLLLIFITLVAAFSVCNTLITMSVQKTREIGLLKAIGYNPGHIMRIFLWQGWIQGVLGTVLGLSLGLVVLRYRNLVLEFLNKRLSYELLPKSLYHLNEIPASTSSQDVLIVVVSVMLICTVAGLIPAYRAARLEPASALRYE